MASKKGKIFQGTGQEIRYRLIQSQCQRKQKGIGETKGGIFQKEKKTQSAN